MDAAGFSALVEAYGADARRWSADRLEAAEAFRAAEPASAADILAREAGLDELLDALRPPVASAALHDRILAAAPRPRPEAGRAWLAWLRPGVGIAMAASCAAGAVTGGLLVQPPPARDPGADLLASVTAPGELALADDGEDG